MTILTVSFVVHRNFQYITRALQSLYETTTVSLEVHVIINTGDDPHLQPLRERFPQVTYLINQTPQGFAANHNIIMRQAQTEFVAILNDDIEIQPGAIDTLVRYLQQNPQVAVVGGRLNNADGSQQVSVYSDPALLRTLYRISGLAMITSQNSALRKALQKLGLLKLFKTESLHFDNQIRAVPIVKGAAMVVRRSAYEAVGLMDETTRMYGEESDWHWRFRKAGWQVLYIPDAVITHFGTGQASLNLQGWLLAEDRKAILYYYLKHRPLWQSVCVRAGIAVAHTFWAVVWLLLNRHRSQAHWATILMALTFRRPT